MEINQIQTGCCTPVFEITNLSYEEFHFIASLVTEQLIERGTNSEQEREILRMFMEVHDD